MLEWVLNTCPFGDFLQDKSRGPGIGAHSRYYPGDWGSNACRNHLKNATPALKESAFVTALEHFNPAFRFFFLERFSNVRAMAAAKNNFARSVAANSMVGHILGIGDRHTHNILLNNKTGACVHIDFGIVFGQGKVLTTPETVPFRLTQDVVDGLGVNGTGGLFRSSCEEVLAILRENRSSLMTILAVLANDPLIKFAVSKGAIAAKQAREEAEQGGEGGGEGEESEEEGDEGDEGEDVGGAAARILRIVNGKLRGFEDSTAEQLSVAGQVALLIAQARSAKNLSQLFPGWAPWV